MRHSLRLRLLVILIAVPVVALASVAVAVRVSSDSTLDGRLQFQIQPLRRAGGGPTGTDENDEIPVFTTELDIDSSRGVTFTDPASGDEYSIQTQPGFIEAYERDRDETVSAINRQVTVAAIAVTAVALGVAVWLSSRIVRPVERLTRAARRLKDGDLSQRVDVSSQDEIGDLGHAFNAMAASIEHNQDLRRQMTSDVAHELRTPLNNISGYLDAIADGVVEPDPSTIASLQEETALLVRLVSDLEQLSLADAGRQVLVKQRLNLADVVDRAVTFVTPRARARGITIQSQCSATPAVEGDGDRLAQVVRNLLENAVTHTPEGGRITVTVRPEGRNARLSVSDTGPGIAEQHLPLIFERFYRGDPSRTRATGGAGLGLAIVKQLVEAHSGTVSVENLPRSGASFTVTLPLAASVPAPSGVLSAQPLPRPS